MSPGRLAERFLRVRLTGAWTFGEIHASDAPAPPPSAEEEENMTQEEKEEALFKRFQEGNDYSYRVPISFPIPLSAAISETNVHYLSASVKAATGKGDLNGTNTISNASTVGSGIFSPESTIYGEGIPAGTKILKVEGSTLEISNDATLTKDFGR